MSSRPRPAIPALRGRVPPTRRRERGLPTLVTAAGRHIVTRPIHARRVDEHADAVFDLIDRDRASVVRADDGLRLAVRECGARDAPITVLFVHGFANRMSSFHLQRAALAQRWGGDVRMVFFDLRGHGRSDVPPRESCTIDQLGRDIGRVIEATAPRGPVIVIGHSMGGMALLAAARQCDRLFAQRVVGIGLLSTAAEGVARAGVARHLRHPAIDAFRLGVATAPQLVQRGRGLARAVIAPLLHAASFRSPVSPTLSRFVNSMIDDTSVETLVKFLATLEAHDESAALARVADVPALVLGGDRDLIIPFRSVAAIARALPRSRLVRVRGAGHMVHLEFPDLVNDAIDDLLRRSLRDIDLDIDGDEASVG